MSEEAALPDDVLYVVFEHLRADPRPTSIANVDFRNIALSAPILAAHGRRLLYSTISVHSGAGRNDLELLASLEGTQLFVEHAVPLRQLVKSINVCTWDGSLSAQAFGTLEDLWRLCSNLTTVTFQPLRASDLEQAVVALSESPVAENLESLSLSHTQSWLLPRFFDNDHLTADEALQRFKNLRSISFQGGSWPTARCTPFLRLARITLTATRLASFMPLIDAASSTLVDLEIDADSTYSARAGNFAPFPVLTPAPHGLSTPAPQARYLKYVAVEVSGPVEDITMSDFADAFSDFLASFPFLTHLSLRLPFHADRLSDSFDEGFAQIMKHFPPTLRDVRFHHRHYTAGQIGSIVAWIQQASNLKRVEFRSYLQGNGADLLEEACAAARVELDSL